MNRNLCLLAVSLAALGVVATATTPATANAASRDEQANACRGDAIHFCAADIPNEEKITACMKRHIDELSPPCRAMFGNGRNGHKNGNNNGARNGGQ
jgi:hypothetical protein